MGTHPLTLFRQSRRLKPRPMVDGVPEKRRFPCTARGAVNVCHVRCDTGCPIWERFGPLQGYGKSKGLHGLEPWAFETCGEEAAGLESVMEGWRFSYAICRRMPVAERGERRRIVPHDV